MYAWSLGGSTSNPPGTADADHPSYAKVERRRQSDLEFLAWVKVATQEELEKALPTVKGWRLVAVQRRLKRSAE